MEVSYKLFDKVFIKNEQYNIGINNNLYNLPDDFNYNGMSYDQIKTNYLNLSLTDLRDILYLYDVYMNYKDYGTNYYPLFKHQNRVISTIQYIEDRISDNLNTVEVTEKKSNINHDILKCKYKQNLDHVKKFKKKIEESKSNYDVDKFVDYSQDYKLIINI